MTKQGGWQPSGFGGRLRNLRESRGWTQAELSQRAGCNRFTVAKLERGFQEPGWPLGLLLAQALGGEVGAFVAPGNGAVAEPGPAPRGRPRKAAPEEASPEQPKRPRGRPRKLPATAQGERSASEKTERSASEKTSGSASEKTS